MNWGSLSEFLAMGGYAFYVWGSYLVTFVLLAWEVAAVLRRHRTNRRRLSRSTGIASETLDEAQT